MSFTKLAFSAAINHIKPCITVGLIMKGLAEALLITLHLLNDAGLLGKLLCALPTHDTGFIETTADWIICTSPVVYKVMLGVILSSERFQNDPQMMAGCASVFVFILLTGYRVAKWGFKSIGLVKSSK